MPRLKGAGFIGGCSRCFVVTLRFNKPFVTGREIDYVRDAVENGVLAGDGPYTKRCEAWLEQAVGCRQALLTNSCTAALEMAAILAGLGPGDEVIMPSYTFVSTANAFVLQGAVPVFVDIRPDTLNLDETLIEAAITPKTRAIVPVHYAGVGCEMDAIMEIAARHNLVVIEDAAQGVMARYHDRPLGGLGHMGCYSFHETKNILSGEGGALLVNDARFLDRAEIIWEKGTNRRQFFRGQVDKYTWVDVGSSFLPSELVAAFLLAQLEDAERITQRRMEVWDAYHTAFAGLEAEGRVQRPKMPPHTRHNAHMYYLLLPDMARRDAVLKALNDRDIKAVFHYVPLHSAPAGRRYGRAHGELAHTDALSGRLLRLPLWVGINAQQVADIQRIVAAC